MGLLSLDLPLPVIVALQFDGALLCVVLENFFLDSVGLLELELGGVLD
jgi:hypothetical protein